MTGNKCVKRCQCNVICGGIKYNDIGLYLDKIGSDGLKDTGRSTVVHKMTSDTKVNVMISDTKCS